MALIRVPFRMLLLPLGLVMAMAAPPGDARPEYDLVRLRLLSGKEFEFMRQAVVDGKLSGDGRFTKKCHALLEKELGAGKQYDSEHEKPNDRFDKANAALVVSRPRCSCSIWK